MFPVSILNLDNKSPEELKEIIYKQAQKNQQLETELKIIYNKCLYKGMNMSNR